jgi:ribosome-associated heat shock protein Hsp15
MTDTQHAAPLRIDKWLWAARFYKTRSLATDEITKGRIMVNGQVCKASKTVAVGDSVSLRIPGYTTRTVRVQGISAARGPATIAQHLYTETEESLAAQHAAREQRRFGQEPALSLPHGRPTKRDRRVIDEVSRQPADSNER